ncbi:MAG: rhodanese-like domain-containing protein [Candidatus Puniceispirillaceae bacterium]
MTKSAMGFLEEANKTVPRLSTEDALAKFGNDNVVIIDVRDGKAIDETGTIKGALRIPRGFIEFAADETTDFHNADLHKDKEILVVCAAGGMAALTGRTLQEMGYEHVYNIGGFSAWKDAGGPTES